MFFLCNGVFFWRIKVVHGHEWRSTLSNIFVGDAKTSSSVAAYLIHFRICDNHCQQWGYHGALSYCTNFSGMWNNLGAGLPSSLDTAAAQLPFQKHSHRELLCWISLLYFWQWAVEGWEGMVIGSWGIYPRSHWIRRIKGSSVSPEEKWSVLINCYRNLNGASHFLQMLA